MTAGRLDRKKTIVLMALLAAAAAIVVGVLVQGGPRVAGAADHLDAPSATPPPGGDGIGTDLTDIYAFQSPADALSAAGFTDVSVYAGGKKDWTEAGLALEGAREMA